MRAPFVRRFLQVRGACLTYLRCVFTHGPALRTAVNEPCRLVRNGDADPLTPPVRRPDPVAELGNAGHRFQPGTSRSDAASAVLGDRDVRRSLGCPLRDVPAWSAGARRQTCQNLNPSDEDTREAASYRLHFDAQGHQTWQTVARNRGYRQRWLTGWNAGKLHLAELLRAGAQGFDLVQVFVGERGPQRSPGAPVACQVTVLACNDGDAQVEVGR